MDLAIETITGADPVEIEPNRQPGRFERIFQCPHRGKIFARIADEDRTIGHFGRWRRPPTLSPARQGVTFTPMVFEIPDPVAQSHHTNPTQTGGWTRQPE